MLATKIPEIPGTLASPESTGWLMDKVAKLCHLSSSRFPGSQPVSFEQESLSFLEQEDFWVCEKSDGVRVLVLILLNQLQKTQDVFLIDRKEEFRQVTGLKFPNGENPKANALLGDTILDGELVYDIDPKTGEETLRLYAFDCLVFSGDNLFSKPLSSRYGRLRSWVVEPLRRLAPSPNRPFDIVLKSMELAYGVEKVFQEDIPKLQHGHDGLIFTCCGSGYTVGTDPKILKWKPPSENSIDFKLTLHFPPHPSSSASPDFTDMPVFKLHQWMGLEDYEFFDTMTVTEEEWEEMKLSSIQYDDAIVEVTWSAERDTWVILRVRDDKLQGNHFKTVQSILKSIADGVEAPQLFQFSQRIRSAWKSREAAKKNPPSKQRPPPPLSSHSHSNSRPPPPAHHYQQQQQQPMGYSGPGGGGGGGAIPGLRR